MTLGGKELRKEKKGDFFFTRGAQNHTLRTLEV